MAAQELAQYVEQELSITARAKPQVLRALREAQRRWNRLGVMRAKAFAALFVVHWQAFGGVALVRQRLAKR